MSRKLTEIYDNFNTLSIPYEAYRNFEVVWFPASPINAKTAKIMFMSTVDEEIIIGYYAKSEKFSQSHHIKRTVDMHEALSIALEYYYTHVDT